MKAQAMIMPKKFFFDKDGNPLAFGKVYTYQTLTVIEKETFTTENGDVDNPNPVILNGEGYATIYLNGSYKIVVDDQDDNNIWTEDPVSSNIAEEWINCQTPTYVSSTSFKIVGNVTDEYAENLAVRIDNNIADYSFSFISSSSFAAGETTIVITDAVVDVGVVEVCVSIFTGDSVNLKPALINDISQTYNFATAAAYKAFTRLFPVGKRIYLADRNAYFEVIAGNTATVDHSVIFSTEVNQSIALVKTGEVRLSQFGVGDDATSTYEDAVNYMLGDAIDIDIDITCKTDTGSVTQDVNIFSTNDSSITFENTCSLFMSPFSSNFKSKGVRLVGTETGCVVANFATDSHMEHFEIDAGYMTGALRFFYNSSNTLNPLVTPHGIDKVTIKGVEFFETLLSIFVFDNMPYKIFKINGNNVTNFSRSFASLGISNGHPYNDEMYEAKLKTEVLNNGVLYTDDWWTTNETDIVTYGVFVLHEGNEMLFDNNTIEGIKARRQAGDAGLSHSTAYWLYMGGRNNTVTNNKIKNCFSFGSRVTHNVAFKQKLAVNLLSGNNEITFDDDWLDRVGEAISDTDDVHIINDIEQICDDITYKDNLIELMANGSTYFSDISNYTFKDNKVRKGPTNLATIGMGFPFITYSDDTLNSELSVNFSSNEITNKGGTVSGLQIKSNSTSMLDPLIQVNANTTKSHRLLNLVRVSSTEDYDVDMNDNTAYATEYATIFGVEGAGAVCTTVTGRNNRLVINPATTGSMRGFGILPIAKTIDLQTHITSEGSIGNFLIIDGDEVYSDTDMVVHGFMSTTRGRFNFNGIFSLTNVSAGVNRISFIDTDGSTPRTVDSNTTDSFNLNMVSTNGGTVRMNIRGTGGSNQIIFAMSESSEGVETDTQVTYDVTLYGIQQ